MLGSQQGIFHNYQLTEHDKEMIRETMKSELLLAYLINIGNMKLYQALNASDEESRVRLLAQARVINQIIEGDFL